jgi:hypothetical protein
MENQQEQINMMMMFKRMLQEQRTMSKFASAMERLVHRHGQFNRKDVFRYLRDYKAEMLRCGISKGLQVLSFNRVAMMSFREASLKLDNNTRHGQRLKKH